MLIESTVYERDDGLTILAVKDVFIILHGKRERNRFWVLRRINEPSWFFNSKSNRWVSILEEPDYTKFAIPFEEAYKLLETLEQ